MGLKEGGGVNLTSDPVNTRRSYLRNQLLHLRNTPIMLNATVRLVAGLTSTTFSPVCSGLRGPERSAFKSNCCRLQSCLRNAALCLSRKLAAGMGT